MAVALPPLAASVRTRDAEGPVGFTMPRHDMLPKQPGNNWSDAAFRKCHAKRQALRAEAVGAGEKEYRPVLVRTHPAPPHRAGADGEASRRLERCLLAATAPPPGDDPPPCTQQRAAVLRWWGYWREAPAESAAEATRVRRVELLFYPDDGTMMIIEPRVPNSGIQGGTVVRRHRVPAPRRRARGDNDDDRWIDLDDLNVGAEVVVYGKRIRLADCDQSTRDYITNVMGVDVPAPEDYPDDEYFDHRKKRVDPTKSPRTYDDFDFRMTFEQSTKGRVMKHYPDEIQRVQKFLKDGKKVCRFWAFWDDSGNAHGDLRRYEIRYFLEDDTVEVIERSAGGNTGREGGRAFMRRCRLPRESECARQGVELTFAARVNGIRHGAGDKWVGLDDLRIGKEIEVYSRNLEIYKADKFTRQYYASELGIDLAPDTEPPSSEKPPPPALPPPRHNGFGTEEDSLGNCRSLLCKPPKVDLKKWQLHADDVLRFQLKLSSPASAAEGTRRFVLRFHLADDTLVVNELGARNSGFLPGRFLKRQKVKKHAGEGPSTFFAAADFFPGAQVTICGHAFEVVMQDRRTDVMKDPSLQEHRPVTSQRVVEIGAQLRDALLARHLTTAAAFRHYDTGKDGLLGLAEFKAMLAALQMAHVSGDECVAVMQHWNTDHDGKLSLNELVAGINGDVPAPREGIDFGRDATCYHDRDAARPNERERRRVLRIFKEKLESRQVNVFDMYRMLSTMPAAYSDAPTGLKDAQCLSSGGTDGLLGPVQLRRAIEERLNLRLSEKQLDELVAYFFPALPPELYKATPTRGATLGYRLTLPQFQEKWNAMELLGQLSPSDGLDAHSLTPL